MAYTKPQIHGKTSAGAKISAGRYQAGSICCSCTAHGYSRA